MSVEEEVAIKVWLVHIEETDPAIIASVLHQCRTDADTLDYFSGRAGDMPRPVALEDDWRHCDQCANLIRGGPCLAARRGEIAASRNCEPVRDSPRRREDARAPARGRRQGLL
jgi:hypothetical protein